MFFKTTKQQASTTLTLMMICTIVILQLILTNSAEARYLPTRADETDVEVLKNIIKGLLSQQQQLYGQEDLMMNNMGGKHDRQHQADRQCFHPLPVPLEKRSAEIPLINNGGDPDTRLPSKMM